MGFIGGNIFSVFVVNPENNKKGIKIIGDISIANYKDGTIVEKNIPNIKPNKHSITQINQKLKNAEAVDVKPTVKYTKNTNIDGITAVSGNSIASLEK